MYRRLILVAALLVAGCQSDPEPAPSLPPAATESPAGAPEPSPSEPASPTTSSQSTVEPGSFPPIPSEASDDEVAVRKAIEAYWDVFARYAADPDESDLTDAQLVTAPGSDEAQTLLDQIAVLRDENTRIEGDWKLRDLTVQIQGNTAVAKYCLDRQAIVVRDLVSDEIVAEGLPAMTVKMDIVPGSDGVWRVATSRNAVEPC